MFQLMMNSPLSTTQPFTGCRSVLTCNSSCETFYHQVQNWCHLEQNYIAKLNDISDNILNCNRNQYPIHIHNDQLSKIINIFIKNHQNLFNKFSQDIISLNSTLNKQLIINNRKLIDEQKNLRKSMTIKKQIIQKSIQKKQKIRKNKQQEGIQHIFMNDSVDVTLQMKIRKFQRIKELEKQQKLYELKIQDNIDQYNQICQQYKQNYKKFQNISHQQIKCRKQAVIKIQLYLQNYCKNIRESIQKMSVADIQSSKLINTQSITDSSEIYIFPEDFVFVEKYLPEVINKYIRNPEFIEITLKIISSKKIDQLIEYSKNKEIKIKIKKLVSSDSLEAEQTDQLSRQVKLIKKMIHKGVQNESLVTFRNIIKKNSKARLNFIFMLQILRLQGRFQIPINKIYQLHTIIRQFLSICNETKDCFVLKYLMVLLLTYYISHHQEQQCLKLYIINFFKRDSLWQNSQLWQSLLIQCIYTEKKSSAKMTMSVSDIQNQHHDLQSAQRETILNQFAYVIKNMIIFQRSEKDVKIFIQKYQKILGQDAKYFKDITKIVQLALEEQKQAQKEQSIIQCAYSHYLKEKQ